MPTVRSLSDLRTLIPEPEPEARPDFLSIPCARCGDSFNYFEARTVAGPYWWGFVHPFGCDPKKVEQKRERDRYQSEHNGNKGRDWYGNARMRVA